MRTFRLGEDIPLEAKSVTTTLNQVQVQVEEYFSEIRGQLLEYDAILSTQRDTIYQRRARMLAADADSSQATLREWCVETMSQIQTALANSSVAFAFCRFRAADK